MARNHANSGSIYRAVITKAFANGRTVTHMFGPYDTPGPAKGLITAAQGEARRSHGRYRNPDSAFTVTARVETADVVWREAQ